MGKTKYSCNSIGNPVFILYNDVEYSYDVWGNIRNVFGSMASTLGQDNPIRYRGYYYDNETKLYYVSSRYYSLELCRFISVDNIIDIRGLNTLNPYAYCGNNSVNNGKTLL